MGKPRLIIIIRHAQSEGNQNRQIHQTVPDHRVKLTPEGWKQAYDAGHRLRSMLRPSDTLQFFVSPYRRTRETTHGILETLTSDSPDPSPFSKHAIKVWEEPRLREQDFGNFQPNASEMERMWKERADYGHFFYRIPNGESAADAYDRVSGFNESLWRSFGEEDFPSVCVLVTHGLMTRVFLMKWYHWSVEYFEDLRNVNHCEFVVMQRSIDSGKFLLQNQLRTWSELKRLAAAERGEDPEVVASPTVPARKRWGGFPEGREQAHNDYPTRAKRRDTRDSSSKDLASIPKTVAEPPTKATEVPIFPKPLPRLGDLPETKQANKDNEEEAEEELEEGEEDDEAFPKPEDGGCGPSDRDLRQVRSNTAAAFTERLEAAQRSRPFPSYLEAGRDFGGTNSGAATPAENEQGFDFGEVNAVPNECEDADRADNAPGMTFDREQAKTWSKEFGMGSGARADALGDHADDEGGTEGDSSLPVR